MGISEEYIKTVMSLKGVSYEVAQIALKYSCGEIGVACILIDTDLHKFMKEAQHG